MTFRTSIRSYLKTSLFAMGLDLKRLSYLDSPQYRLQTILRLRKINAIFDVGANTGQFALALREIGYKGRIISIEPLLSAHQTLIEASSQDKNWIVHPRCAISDHEGTQTIHVSENSVSSSLRPQLPIHLKSAPQSKIIGQDMVNVTTLDSLFSSYASAVPSSTNNYLLKVDAQGHEFSILEKSNILTSLSAILLELSVEPMFEGEQTLHFISEWLSNHGFKLWSLAPSFADSQTGRIMQYDGLFINWNLS